MRKFPTALIGIVLLVAVAANQFAWNSFKLKYNKNYKNIVEERARMRIFLENFEKIIEHNKLFKNGHVSYEKGLNEFSDTPDDEFHSKVQQYDDYGGRDGKARANVSLRPNDANIPDSIDWRTSGAVTDVKHQGHCDACWTFASCGALEAAHFLKTGVLRSLSAQNLLDCVRTYTMQCYTGTFRDAYRYIIQNGGIDTAASYPYHGHKGHCQYNSTNSGALVKAYVQLPKGDEMALTHAIATVGPVTVAIDRNLIKHYERGVFYDPKCSQHMNHNVLAVGYSSDPDYGDYYIVKNSWGAQWGENGYIRMARNKNKNCGIANDAGYPIV